MDNFIVSARKYRPSTFATVVGQAAITNTLKNAIRNKQLAQAFLFTGPRGVGKTTCARILAKTINCSNITEDGEACNTCQSCQSFNKTSSFNIFELDAASNNTVDDIRNLVEQVRIPPQQGYKVYIVDEVHMLSQSAFNAFLKTLEEPPAYAKFILATTEKHKILPTILSRCQIFDFRRISVDDISNHLEYVAQNEHIQAEPEALHIIAQKADGGLRDALSMFDQLVSYAGDKLTYKQVIENLNVLDYEYYFRITEYILAGDISNTLLTINEILDNGFEGQHFITGLGQHLRNLLVSKDPITLQLLETSNSVRDEYYNQSVKCSVPFLLKSLEITNDCDINYKTSNNKKLHIEIALIQLCKLSVPEYQVEVKPVTTGTPAVHAKPQATGITSQSKPTGTQQTQQSSVHQSAQQQTTPSIAAEPVPANPNKAATTQQNKAETTDPKPAASSGTPSLSGLNLGNLMTGKKPDKKEENTDKEEETPGESYGNEQAGLSDVHRVWPQLIESVAKELPLLESTLHARLPEMDGTTVVILIENPLQQEEIFRNKPEITLFLRKALRNDSISVETKMLEFTQETRRPYTDSEKFEYIANKAPVLKVMKDQLGLDLEL